MAARPAMLSIPGAPQMLGTWVVVFLLFLERVQFSDPDDG